MDVIESNIENQAADFQNNLKHMRSLVTELAESLSSVRERDDTDSAQRHRSRGKMMVRDRVRALLDPGTPFLEFSPLAAWQMYDCLLYTSPSPRDRQKSRMPSSG